MEITVTHIITEMLAPGLMISACGLLLLGMNNKYSLIINRIRVLDEEKRKMSMVENRPKLNEQEHMRLHSVIKQLLMLHYRIKLVRNAVVSYSIAVALFILSSFFIGLHFVYDRDYISNIIITSFLLGMFCILSGILYAAFETIRGYQIVEVEMMKEKQ
jgi:hypothetical protein